MRNADDPKFWQSMRQVVKALLALAARLPKLIRAAYGARQALNELAQAKRKREAERLDRLKNPGRYRGI